MFKKLFRKAKAAVSKAVGTVAAAVKPAVDAFGRLQVKAVTAIGGEKVGAAFAKGQAALGGGLAKVGNFAAKAATGRTVDEARQLAPAWAHAVGGAYGSAFEALGEKALSKAVGELGGVVDGAKGQVAELAAGTGIAQAAQARMRDAQTLFGENALKMKGAFPLWYK